MNEAQKLTFFEKKQTVCPVCDTKFYREDLLSGGGRLIAMEFEDDGFVRHMIRNIVGTLVDCGRGRLDVEEMPRILAATERKQAGHCAPACGLYLVRVLL